MHRESALNESQTQILTSLWFLAYQIEETKGPTLDWKKQRNEELNSQERMSIDTCQRGVRWPIYALDVVAVSMLIHPIYLGTVQ